MSQAPILWPLVGAIACTVALGCKKESPDTPLPVAPTHRSADSTPSASGDDDTRAWEGTWFDPETAYKTWVTVAIRGGVPQVVRVAESIGEKEVYEVRGSSWQSGTLRWSHYVPSTNYLVTFACTRIEDNALVCRWSNDHNASGKGTLPRVGDAPPSSGPPVGQDARAWAGGWIAPHTAFKTETSIAVRGGVPTVVRVAETLGKAEEFELRSTTWRNGTLTWTYYVPSTQYVVTYSCNEARGDTLVCKWKNDRQADGTETLTRSSGAAPMQGGGSTATPPSPPPPPPPPKRRSKEAEDE